MSMNTRARALKDHELLAALSSIVRRSNELTAELIEHLVELEQRQLHLDLGFPSLFAYCVEALGLCEATAGRRIAAARVCRRYPQALSLVASGALHVSALCLLKPYLTPDSAAELFELCGRTSARKIEQLLAARFSKPDWQDSIRRVPVPPSTALNVESAAFQAPCSVASVPSPSIAPLPSPGSAPLPSPGSAPPADVCVQAESQRRSPLATRSSTKLPAPITALRPQALSPDRFGVRFTADREFCELLERVRGLAAHRLPSGDLLALPKQGLQAYERELAKQRFGVGRKPRGPLRNDSPAASSSSRPGRLRSATRPRPPAAVVREVYTRDEGRCTFISEDGRRCATHVFLELDHAIPWAIGGDDSTMNLRLRCRAHNQRAAQQYFGVAHVRDAATRAHLPSESSNADSGVTNVTSSERTC